MIRLNLGKDEDKARLWTIATWFWWGSFRGRELLGEASSTFNPNSTLLSNDVLAKAIFIDGKKIRILIVNLKNPKEAKGNEVQVELIENGGKTCPVRAFMAWQKTMKKKPERNLPLFMKTDGSVTTTAEMNSLLKRVFDGSFCNGRYVSLHSFRSGLASEMALAGYDDEAIQTQGRWKSDAYKNYIKLGRAQRIGSQLKLAEVMAC